MEPASPFPVTETHGAALWPKNTLIAHSGGLSWQNLYVSLSSVRPWQATVPAISHHCLAYCLSQPSPISRTIDGERPMKAVLKPRQFGMIPAFVPSHWTAAGSPEIMLIYIRKSVMDEVAAQVFDRDPARIEILPPLGVADALLEQLALALLDELRQPDKHRALYSDSLGHAMAAQLLRRYVASGPSPLRPVRASDISKPGLQRALDFIEAGLDGNLGIEEIARAAGLAPLSFARAFRQQVGVAPHQYVMDRRIARARAMLAGSDAPLVEIGLSTGFSSQSHFSSAFRRAVGVTPKEYRRGG